MAGPVRAGTGQGSIGAGAGVPERPWSGIVVGRFQGTVVVTVHGDLDARRASDLDYVLADLIDGQGNKSLAIDLRDATATDAQWLTVFTDAAARACQRGAVLALDGAPAFLGAALRSNGLGPALGSVDIEQLDA